MSGSDQNYFDVQFAINQFSGNQSLLVKILEKFNQQYQHFDTLLKEKLQQDEILSVQQQVHEIKGVSGNLGMQALHLACKDLEANMKVQITEKILDSFLQVFKQTLALVHSYLAENGNEKSPEAAPQQEQKIALVKALKRNEFISDTKMQTFVQSLDMSSEKLTELQQAIDNLDYPNAIKLLEQ